MSGRQSYASISLYYVDVSLNSLFSRKQLRSHRETQQFMYGINFNTYEKTITDTAFSLTPHFPDIYATVPLSVLMNTIPSVCSPKLRLHVSLEMKSNAKDKFISIIKIITFLM